MRRSVRGSSTTLWANMAGGRQRTTRGDPLMPSAIFAATAARLVSSSSRNDAAPPSAVERPGEIEPGSSNLSFSDVDYQIFHRVPCCAVNTPARTSVSGAPPDNRITASTVRADSLTLAMEMILKRLPLTLTFPTSRCDMGSAPGNPRKLTGRPERFQATLFQDALCHALVDTVIQCRQDFL